MAVATTLVRDLASYLSENNSAHTDFTMDDLDEQLIAASTPTSPRKRKRPIANTSNSNGASTNGTTTMNHADSTSKKSKGNGSQRKKRKMNKNPTPISKAIISDSDSYADTVGEPMDIDPLSTYEDYDYKPESNKKPGKRITGKRGTGKNKRENGRSKPKRDKGKKEKSKREVVSDTDVADESMEEMDDIFSDSDQESNKASTSASALKNDVNQLGQESKGREKAKDASEPNLPFGGKLTAEEADISKTRPDEIDKLRFERAKSQAEPHDPKPEPLPALDAEEKTLDYIDATPKIRCIRFGDWEIDTWFAAPYPEEYSTRPVLYICEFCLKYMKSQFVANRHKQKCPMRHPPGDEIYRDMAISIFEVDGRKNKIYCQNLCLLAKQFLDHKTLYYDVEPFLFYVMTESTDTGCHFVGYFSKEKRSPLNYNVSCILTLPIHQRKGYGNLLIDFSYLLSKKENKTGSPEKPLSDLGLLSYRNYWRNVIFEELRDAEEPISIEELSRRTSMTPDDVVATLQTNNMIVKDKDNDTYNIVIDQERIEKHCQAIAAKGYPQIKPENLKWTPFILTRGLGIRLVEDEDEQEDTQVDEKTSEIKSEKGKVKAESQGDEGNTTIEEDRESDPEIEAESQKREGGSKNKTSKSLLTLKEGSLRRTTRNRPNGADAGEVNED